MKYSELHRKLRKAGCYPTGLSMAKHHNGIAHARGECFTPATTTKKKWL